MRTISGKNIKMKMGRIMTREVKEDDLKVRMTKRGESQEDQDEKMMKQKMFTIKCNYEAYKEKHKENDDYDKKLLNN